MWQTGQVRMMSHPGRQHQMYHFQWRRILMQGRGDCKVFKSSPKWKTLSRFRTNHTVFANKNYRNIIPCRYTAAWKKRHSMTAQLFSKVTRQENQELHIWKRLWRTWMLAYNNAGKSDESSGLSYYIRLSLRLRMLCCSLYLKISDACFILSRSLGDHFACHCVGTW